nr:hypothetical protein [Tanacetum cinerariifolium]
MQRFLRLAGFLRAAAGTEEEQAKNFQWGRRRSTLNHLMCMSYTDVTQVANASRNYEILHERDDDDAERPDKRHKSGDRHQPTSQQSSHKNHVCTTCGRRHPGECRRAVGTCFKCGQAGHLQKHYKKNTTASTSGQADKKPGALGCVFAITEGHAANTSERRYKDGRSQEGNQKNSDYDHKRMNYLNDITDKFHLADQFHTARTYTIDKAKNHIMVLHTQRRGQKPT